MSLSIVGTPITWVETITNTTHVLHVIGEVANGDGTGTTDPAQSVYVTCTLYDSSGKALAHEQRATEANILLNGDHSPFDAWFPTPPVFDHFGCALSGGASTTHVADHNLTATITTVVTDTSHIQHVSGNVVINNLDLVPDSEVKAMVIFRDSGGALIDAASVYINNHEAVLPGQAYPFTIDRYTDQPLWDGIIAHASTLTEAAAPAVVDPSAMAFGNQIQGTTSATMTAYVGNNGTGDLHVANVALGTGSDFAITSNGCAGAAVHVDATCAITITFTPTGLGIASDTLNFTDDADTAPHTVSISGNGISRAMVSASPLAIDFPGQLDTTTTTKTATISSAGLGALKIGHVSLAPAGVFTLDNAGCPDGLSVAAGSSCTVTVMFTPTAPVTSLATLTIVALDPNGIDAARNSPIMINVTGTGMAGSGLLSRLPSNLDYGNQNVSSASGAKRVTLSNDGTAAITFSPFTFTGPAGGDYSETDACLGSPLQAKGVCTVDVTFTPSSAGTRTAQLVISDSANNLFVSLTGNGVAAPPPGGGYWLVGTTGGIATFGDATSFGSINTRLNKPIVGMAVTPDHKGYWLVATDGGIFTFGDAPFLGSTGSLRLNKPIVGMASTPSGLGYWLVASDGGIFTFGDAPFMGSTGSLRLNKPVVGMAPTHSGQGYWLVASDGGIFTFGDAPFKGSTGSLQLNQPVDGMAATPSGQGYWMVAADGGIFTFGDAAFKGSSGGNAAGIVGMAATASGQGYRIASSAGTVLAFGDAVDLGSVASGDPRLPIAGMAAD